MSFLNFGALYFLPLALLPLIALLVKKPGGRVRLVSWLFLLRNAELTKKRKLRRNLIIVLRCLILVLLIFFMAKPLPSWLSFKKVYFERGIFSEKIERKNLKDFRLLVSYYGERVRAFTDPLTEEEEADGRFYVISDFSDPLFYQRIPEDFCFDTISVLNAGINYAEFDPFGNVYYLRITNYNTEDSLFYVTVFQNSEKLFESSTIVPKGKSVLWGQKIPLNEKRVEVRLRVDDDIESDNKIELYLPARLTYSMIGENQYVENFMQLLGNKVDMESAEVIIAINRMVKPGKKTRRIIIFFNKPSEQLKSILGLPLRKAGPLKVSGWRFDKVYVFRPSTTYPDLKSLMESSTYRLILSDVDYLFIGFVPDIEENEMVYCPDFWSYLLQAMKIKPVIAYTSSKEKAGKLTGDTLILQDTLQVNTARLSPGNFNSRWIPRREVFKKINTVRYLFLSLLMILALLEFYLAYRYFSE